MEIVFQEFRVRFLVFFGCLGTRLSDFLVFESKLANRIGNHQSRVLDLAVHLASIFKLHKDLKAYVYLIAE